MGSLMRLDLMPECSLDCDYGDEGPFEAGLAALAGGQHCTSFAPTPVAYDTAPTSSKGRPRGGKKPSRPRQQALDNLKEELEQKLNSLREELDKQQRLQERIKVLELVLPVREQYALLLKQRHQQRQQQGGCKELLQHGQSRPHQLPIPSHYQHPPGFSVSDLRESSTSSSSGCLGLSPTPSVLPIAPPFVEAASVPPSDTHGFRPNRAARALCGGSALQCKGHTTTTTTTTTTTASPAARRTGTGPGTQSDCPLSAALAAGQVPFTAKPSVRRPPPEIIQQFTAVWNTWVREVGLVLHAHDARPHDPGLQLRLAQLRNQLLGTFTEWRLEYPMLFAELMYVNLETGMRDDPPPESFWLSVAQALRFTSEQRVQCRAVLALYRERVDKLLAERTRLVQRFATVTSALQGHSPLPLSALAVAAREGMGQAWPYAQDVRSVAAGAPCGQLVLQREELMLQLHQNVVAEGQALELIKDFLGNNTLTLVQTARASVLSYPFFPDAVAIINSLVATTPSPPDACAS